MNAGNWTPGPWARSKAHPRRVTANGKIIATGVLRNQGIAGRKILNAKDEAEAIANACLIAISPELFEYVASSAENGCATAQALVSRARGES